MLEKVTSDYPENETKLIKVEQKENPLLEDLKRKGANIEEQLLLEPHNKALKEKWGVVFEEILKQEDNGR